MQDSYKVIQRTIHRVGSEARRISVYEGLSLLVCVFLAIGMAGVFLNVPIARWGLLRAAFFAAWGGALLAVGVKFLLIPILRYRDDGKIALRIEAEYPSLNNDLINSVQLSHELSLTEAEKYFSRQLVNGLVENTASEVRELELDTVIDRRRLWLNCTLLAFLMCALVVLTIGFPSYLSSSLSRILYPRLFRPHDEIVARPTKPGSQEDLTVGDITLIYSYPVYTGLEPRIVVNTDGNIRALKGTEVHIQATVDRAVASANIVLDNSDRIPLKVSEERRVEGDFLVEKEGTYHFEATDSSGHTYVERAEHETLVEADEYPRIVLKAPAVNLEVNQKDSVEIIYETTDDFGVKETALVFERDYKLEGDPGNGRKRLDTFDESSLKQINGRPYAKRDHKWNLSELDLEPGEKLTFYLEALDNDSISGPKKGTSASRTLTVFSAKERHRDLMELQEKLMEAMISLLADHLEEGQAGLKKRRSLAQIFVTQEQLDEKTQALLNTFDALLRKLREDTLANYAIYYSLETMRNNLMRLFAAKRSYLQSVIRRFTVQRGAASDKAPSVVQKHVEDMVKELENDIFALDELLKKQKLDDIVNEGKDLLATQNHIADLLNQLQNGKSSELENKLTRALKKLEKMFDEMMRQLAEMSKGLPDEFVNSEAMKDMRQMDIASEMKKLREALERGDVDEAARIAENILSMMSEMMAMLNQSADAASNSMFSQQLKEMNQLADSITDLEQQQQKLTDETNELKKNVERRTSGELDRTFKEFFEKQLRRLAQIEEAVAQIEETVKSTDGLKEHAAMNREYSNLAIARSNLLRNANTRRQLAQRKGSNRSRNKREGKDSGDQREKRTRHTITSLPNRADLTPDERKRYNELTERSNELRKKLNSNRILDAYNYISQSVQFAKRDLNQLREMLKTWDVKESLNNAKSMGNYLRYWDSRLNPSRRSPLPRPRERSSKPGTQRDTAIAERARSASDLNRLIVKDLESLQNSVGSFLRERLTGKEKGKMRSSAETQNGIRHQADNVKNQANQLSERMPVIGDGIGRSLGRASNSMDKAGGELKRQNAPEALAQERDALYQLSEAKKGLDQAKQRVQQGMMGGGIPMPFRRSMPGADGVLGLLNRDIEIPSEEDYKVPKEFREDILEAMKKAAPEKYKRLNKDYYKRLVE